MQRAHRFQHTLRVLVFLALVRTVCALEWGNVLRALVHAKPDIPTDEVHPPPPPPSHHPKNEGGESGTGGYNAFTWLKAVMDWAEVQWMNTLRDILRAVGNTGASVAQEILHALGHFVRGVLQDVLGSLVDLIARKMPDVPPEVYHIVVAVGVLLFTRRLYLRHGVGDAVVWGSGLAFIVTYPSLALVVFMGLLIVVGSITTVALMLRRPHRVHRVLRHWLAGLTGAMHELQEGVRSLIRTSAAGNAGAVAGAIGGGEVVDQPAPPAALPPPEDQQVPVDEPAPAPAALAPPDMAAITQQATALRDELVLRLTNENDHRERPGTVVTFAQDHAMAPETAQSLVQILRQGNDANNITLQRISDTASVLLVAFEWLLQLNHWQQQAGL